MTDVDIDALIRGRRRRWRSLLPAGAVVVAAAVVAVVLLVGSEEADVVVEPQQVEATTGSLTTTVDLSGSAAAERSADLTFESAGVVTSLSVAGGDAVQAGETLAMLDDAEAQRRIETARSQLRLAHLRLDDLLASAGAADIASALQSIESAESQVASAELALERLLAPARADEVASAEQAVASALGQLSAAEEALARLREPRSAADLASAEQAVASAASQLVNAEDALAALTAVPAEAEVAVRESAVTQARAQLSSAANRAHDSSAALDEAFEDFCDRYDHYDDIEEICTLDVPLSDSRLADLRDSFDAGRGSWYERYANTLINANVAFVVDDSARETAVTSLATAEEQLANLLAPAPEEDIRQAELAVDAARAGHEAAVARLTDLTEPATEDDIFQAEQSVEAARASHDAAVARLADLTEPATEEDIFQAEQSVEAARASHEAAVARLADLRAPAGAGDIYQAEASLESARAGLASAQARYDELLAGSTANAIAQQEENVRLAELSLEEAQAALTELTLVAPFDGVVEAVNVRPGDRVTANMVAVSMSTSDRIVLELTVTEADLLNLEVGHVGLATFDAIDGVSYPVQLTVVSRVPVSAQGVVTYDVQATMLAGADLVAAADQLAALAGAGIGGALGDLAGARGAGGGGFGAAATGPAALLEQVRLPEGVSVEDVLQSLADGEGLPEGVELPEDINVPPEMLQQIARAVLDRGGIGGGRDTAAGAARDGPARPVPAPGMSASVTVLTEQRPEAVLVPVTAVRQLDGAWFVTVPAPTAEDAAAFARVTVEVGVSDGVSVEITSGIEAGAALLIGADTSGIAFSATQQQALQLPGAGVDGRGQGGPAGGGRP